MRTLMITLIGGAMATSACTTEKVAEEPTRTIELTVMAEATPEEVMQLWSTVEGAQSFFAPAARIGSSVGDPYEIVFEPVNDPEGADHGTKGATIRSVDPGHSISFGWTFPPFGDAFNTKPFPTWVEVSAEPWAGDPERSLVRFAHRGFPMDSSWDRVFEIFRDGNWPLVLNRFLVHCRDGVSPAWGDPEGDHLDRFLLKEQVVAAPVPEVWRAWTTEQGLQGFFCEKANVQLEPGGAYEVFFNMSVPEGSRGAEGCRVVAFEAQRWLAFTWNSPPHLPEVRTERTNVIVELEPTLDGSATRVRLTALGWGSSGQWVASHQYFDAAWSKVLEWLAASFAPADSKPDPS